MNYYGCMWRLQVEPNWNKSAYLPLFSFLEEGFPGRMPNQPVYQLYQPHCCVSPWTKNHWSFTSVFKFKKIYLFYSVMWPRRNDALNRVQEKTNKQTKAHERCGDRRWQNLFGGNQFSSQLPGCRRFTSVKVIKERNSPKPKSNLFKGKVVTFAFQKLMHYQFANRGSVIRQETFIWDRAYTPYAVYSQWTGSRGNVVERGSFAPSLSPNFSLSGCLLMLARLRPNRWRDIYDQSKITVPLLGRGDKGEGKRKYTFFLFLSHARRCFRKERKEI